eukprot:TRINITY_DN326_c0_g2_i1.p1 TRINITY_DN326_c0_g2~~TRINITY_DN326_c0_g2_i1.p1  ORF type:complete len:681 (+),score=148.59 TRINITY_DN326_c0_g2_i1:106-2043(+)
MAALDVSQYTYAGVLAWMEQEWRRFHRDREEWQSEKALLCSAVQGLQRQLQALRAEYAQALRRPPQPGAAAAAQQQQQPPGEAQGVPWATPRPPQTPHLDTAEQQGMLAALRLPPSQGVPGVLPPAAAAREPPPEGAFPVHLGSVSDAGSADQVSESGTASSGVDTVVRAFASGGQSEDGLNSSVVRPREVWQASPPPSSDEAVAPPHGLRRASHRVAGASSPNISDWPSGRDSRGSALEGLQSPPSGMPPEDVGPTPTPPVSVPSAADASSSGGRRRWDLRASVRGHFGAVRCACWAGESALALTGGDDHIIRLWDARRVLRSKDRDEPTHTFRGHRAPVVSVRATREEVLAGAADGAIRLWRMPATEGEGEQRTQPAAPSGLGVLLEEHSDAVWGLSVLRLVPGPGPPGRPSSALSFASGGADGKILLWSRAAGAALPSVEHRLHPTPQMTAADFSVAAVHYTTEQLGARRLFAAYCTGTDPGGLAVWQVTWNAAGALDAALMWNRAMQSRPTCISTPAGLMQWVTRRCRGIAQPESAAAVGDASGAIEMIDLSDGSVLTRLVPHTGAVTAVQCIGDALISSSHDGTVQRSGVTEGRGEGELAAGHLRRFGEGVCGVICHAGKGIAVSYGADSSIAWHCAPRS